MLKGIPVAAALACGCGRTLAEPDAVRPVKTETAAGAAYVDKDFVGMATPDDAVNLAFKLAGQVLDLPVTQGQQVRRGELLAELNPRDVELQVSADRSAYEQASSHLSRIRRLLEREAVSRQEYEAARTQYAQAQAAYENSKDMLSDTKLRAPFAGVVEQTFVDNFERVQAGQSIVRIVDPVTTTVKFTMPESGLPLLAQSGTRFSVVFPVSLRLTDVDTLRYRISPGMSCTVTLRSADPVPGAVSLPLTAIYAPAEGGDYVWIVEPDDRVRRQAVTLGEPFGRDRVLIDRGVAAGDRVVVAGVYRLREGERVRILR